MLSRGLLTYRRANAAAEIATEHDTRLARCVLEVLHTFLDCCPVQNGQFLLLICNLPTVLSQSCYHLASVTINVSELLRHLCELLSDRHFRILAVQCLHQLASWQGPSEERKTALFFLFDRQAMEAISRAIERASAEEGSDCTFYKETAELLVAMGRQLLNIYHKEPHQSLPTTLSLYFSTLLSLSRHPSLVVNHACVGSWLSLFKNDKLRARMDLLAVIRPFFEFVVVKLVKPTEPSFYDLLDLDSIEALTERHVKYRSILLQATRCAADLSPSVAVSVAQQWMQVELNKSPGKTRALTMRVSIVMTL